MSFCLFLFGIFLCSKKVVHTKYMERYLKETLLYNDHTHTHTFLVVGYYHVLVGWSQNGTTFLWFYAQFSFIYVCVYCERIYAILERLQNNQNQTIPEHTTINNTQQIPISNFMIFKGHILWNWQKQQRNGYAKFVALFHCSENIDKFFKIINQSSHQ